MVRSSWPEDEIHRRSCLPYQLHDTGRGCGKRGSAAARATRGKERPSARERGRHREGRGRTAGRTAGRRRDMRRDGERGAHELLTAARVGAARPLVDASLPWVSRRSLAGCAPRPRTTTLATVGDCPTLRTRPTAYNMSSIIARSAFRAAPRLQPTPAFRRWAGTTATTSTAHGERQAGKDALKTGAKRDPELYVCCTSHGASAKRRCANSVCRCSSLS